VVERSGWKRFVFAGELPDCKDCGEKRCVKHGKHYADCSCIGPTKDGMEYKTIKSGLYARKVKRNKK